MPVRDPGVAIVLTLRELDVLAALREDRDSCGEGVPRETVASMAGTRWPEDVIRRLRAHRYVIGELGGRYELGHEEPVLSGSTGASVDGRPAVGAPEESPGVPVGFDQPRLFDLCSHYGPVRRAA
jgi:hypothetical protein